MKIIKVSKDGKKLVLTLHVDNRKHTEAGGVTPDIRILNDIIFANKKQALDYYNSILTNNNAVIENNKQRLSQMSTDSLEKINDFAEAINSSQALSRRSSKKIEDLIMVHDNMTSFKNNIAKVEASNKELKEIIKAIKK